MRSEAERAFVPSGNSDIGRGEIPAPQAEDLFATLCWGLGECAGAVCVIVPVPFQSRGVVIFVRLSVPIGGLAVAGLSS